MKHIFLSLFFLAGSAFMSDGQVSRIDSLKKLLEKTPEDTTRVDMLLELGDMYFFSNPEAALVYIHEALNIAREKQFTRGETRSLNDAGEVLRFLGDYPGSLNIQFEALQKNRKINDRQGEVASLTFIGFTYVEFREYRLGLQYLLTADSIGKKLPKNIMSIFTLSNIGNAYNLLNMQDSALYYQQEAYNKITGFTTRTPLKTLVLSRIGNVYASMGKTDSALQIYHTTLLNLSTGNGNINLSKVRNKIAGIYESLQQYDSSIYYARQAFTGAQNISQKLELLESSLLLAKLYRVTHKNDSAFFYGDIAAGLKDSLYGQKKFKQLQLLMLQEQQVQQKIIQEKEAFRNKTKFAALFAALGIFLLALFIVARNNRHKQKINNLLAQQKEKVEITLSELKSTQSQLIQKEKMASLGELTAGIAHEIQNPLNFVNNFSEVSNELLDEMKTALAIGNSEEATMLADDIKQNLEKINHHGKRADAIVKGMLQHSQVSTGQKEPTNINTLADDYLRLSYQGLRAKEKTFTATLQTDFDETIGKINIIPQDVGRVLLNLYNNAFYAVNEKKKIVDENYEPTITVTTKRSPSLSFGEGRGEVRISVKDNGNGIPQKIVDKIFQPFFTTKPTGQGTGLGLSLSYDIIKAHGGEIKVETKENGGTTFIIQLPV